jgi:hypothetical protein
MWDAVDSLIERAPSADALRAHRLHLLAARRAADAGRPVDASLAGERTMAAAAELAVPLLLAQVRAACDAPLVLVKGPELARDYPGPATRPFGDLDLLTDDAPAVQNALLNAGFHEVGEPELYAGIHHLRPLWWPGLTITLEVHSEAKWPGRLTAPSTAELLERTVPSRVGVPGVLALQPDAHALVVAAHSWAHEPLARAGHLVDVAVTLAQTEPAAVDALARRWGCARMWRTTRRAQAALLGDGRSGAVALWSRHLRGARERTVLETHVQEWLSPLWELPPHRALAATARAAAGDLQRKGSERWPAKLSRARRAMGNASVARSEHDRHLERRLDGGGSR